MIRPLSFYLLLSLISGSAFSDDFRKNFESEAKKRLGKYQASSGSNETCTGGDFSFVKDKLENGIHLGQNVFLGPFAGNYEERPKNYCKIKSQYSFGPRSVTQETKIYDCPKEHQAESGTVTKSLELLKDGRIKFQIKETEFKCFFRPVKDGKR